MIMRCLWIKLGLRVNKKQIKLADIVITLCGTYTEFPNPTLGQGWAAVTYQECEYRVFGLTWCIQ